uniref:Uncharacterized protein n=1 Tax=Plectus sambesii TaxID=2011161 RepID=A0A914WXA6_9BILA
MIKHNSYQPDRPPDSENQRTNEIYNNCNYNPRKPPDLQSDEWPSLSVIANDQSTENNLVQGRSQLSQAPTANNCWSDNLTAVRSPPSIREQEERTAGIRPAFIGKPRPLQGRNLNTDHDCKRSNLIRGTDGKNSRNRISLRVATDDRYWGEFMNNWMKDHGLKHTKKAKVFSTTYYLSWKKSSQEIKDLLENMHDEDFWLIEKTIDMGTSYVTVELKGWLKEMDGMYFEFFKSKTTNRFLVSVDGQQQHHAVKAKRERTEPHVDSHTQSPIAEDDWDEDQ